VSAPPGSFILAADFRISGFDAWWRAVQGDHDDLEALGVHRLVVYRSVEDPGHVFVTAGLRTRDRVDRVLSSPLLLHWFDRAGVQDVPPIFVGNRVEKVRYPRAGEDPVVGDRADVPTGVVIARVVHLADYERFLADVQAYQRRSAEAGMRQFWIYRAVDDGAEVMSLQEIDTIEHARAWLRRPESDAQVDPDAGAGVYPPSFVGTVAGVIDLGQD
jgi:hypothetical protein